LQGVDAFDVHSLLYYIEDHKQGAFELGAPNDDVERLTGYPAEDFAATARRYAAMPFARKTFANRLRAFVNFNRVPFSLGYKLSSYERRQSHPPGANLLYAMENNDWKAERFSQLPKQSELELVTTGEFR
jgi:NAD(P)H dehydrogenase (quinone)